MTALVLVAFWIVGLVVAERAHDRMVGEERTQLLSDARHVAADHFRWVEDSRDALAALAVIVREGASDSERCGTGMIETVRRLRGISFALLAAPDGRVLCSPDPASVPPGITAQPFFAHAIETGVFSLGRYQPDRRGEGWVLPFIHPLTDAQNAIASLLIVGRPLDWIYDEVGTLGLAADGEVVLHDRHEGNLLRRPGEANGGLPPATLAALAEADEGIFLGTDLDGTARLYAFAALQPSMPDVHIVVSRPESSVTGPLSAFRAEAVIMLTIFLASAGLLLLAVLTRFVFRPLDLLSEQMGSLGKGGYLAKLPRIPTAPAEVRLLLAAFDRMVEDLGQRDRRAHRADEARTRSEQTLSAVIEATPLGIVVMDAQHRVTLSNAAAGRLLGYLHEGQADGGPFFGQLVRLLGGEHALAGQIEVIRSDGSALELRYSAAALLRRDGVAWAAVFVFEDVTGQAAADHEARQAQKMEALGQLTGGIAHDFNNILTVIIGNLDMLEDDLEPGGPQARLAVRARDAARRGAELNSRLLAFSRRQMLAPEVIDLNQLVTGMHDMLRRSVDGSISLDYVLADEVLPARIDRQQAETALLNLIVNARDALPGGGNILVRSDTLAPDTDFFARHPFLERRDYVRLIVSDDGVGMPPDVKERVFEPFFTTKEKGTGLGLSMVYGLMRQSGGHVIIDSEQGKGTSVSLIFPRSAEMPTGQGASGPEGWCPKGAGETVLVVEDQDDVRATAVRMLGSLGYFALEATNPAAALRTLETKSVDAVFTDVVLPGSQSGLDLAREVRRRWPSVAVVATSGYTHVQVPDPAEGIGWLSKPYRREALACRIRETLDRRENVAGTKET